MARENCSHKGCKCMVDSSKAVSQGGKNNPVPGNAIAVIPTANNQERRTINDE